MDIVKMCKNENSDSSSSPSRPSHSKSPEMQHSPGQEAESCKRDGEKRRKTICQSNRKNKTCSPTPVIKPCLSFGMSRILDDSSCDSDSDTEHDDEFRNSRNKKPKSGTRQLHSDDEVDISVDKYSDNEENSYMKVPKMLPDIFTSMTGNGSSASYPGFPAMPLTLPIHRPHPVFPTLTSYTLPGWLDLRRDRFGGKCRLCQ